MGQVLHPVFSAPNNSKQTTMRVRPIDLAHLASQTGGDKTLEEEVLHLFVRQAALLSRDLKVNSDCDQRKRLAHTLKGTARSVGAFKVAELAEAIEEAPTEQKRVTQLVKQVDTTCDYIASLLR